MTCTDLAILAGNHAETCFGKYGAVPLKVPFCHEMVVMPNCNKFHHMRQALRIILHCIATSAARHRRCITPVIFNSCPITVPADALQLVSLSIDFYARVFVRVRTSAFEVKRLATCVVHCTHRITSAITQSTPGLIRCRQTGNVYCCHGCNSFHPHTFMTEVKRERCAHVSLALG